MLLSRANTETQQQTAVVVVVVVQMVERYAVSVQGRTYGAARHLRSLTPGRLRSHGPVPVHRATQNLPTSVSLAHVHDLLW